MSCTSERDCVGPQRTKAALQSEPCLELLGNDLCASTTTFATTTTTTTTTATAMSNSTSSSAQKARSQRRLTQKRPNLPPPLPLLTEPPRLRRHRHMATAEQAEPPNQRPTCGETTLGPVSCSEAISKAEKHNSDHATKTYSGWDIFECSSLSSAPSSPSPSHDQDLSELDEKDLNERQQDGSAQASELYQSYFTPPSPLTALMATTTPTTVVAWPYWPESSQDQGWSTPRTSAGWDGTEDKRQSEEANDDEPIQSLLTLMPLFTPGGLPSTIPSQHATDALSMQASLSAAGMEEQWSWLGADKVPSLEDIALLTTSILNQAGLEEPEATLDNEVDFDMIYGEFQQSMSHTFSLLTKRHSLFKCTDEKQNAVLKTFPARLCSHDTTIHTACDHNKILLFDKPSLLSRSPLLLPPMGPTVLQDDTVKQACSKQSHSLDDMLLTSAKLFASPSISRSPTPESSFFSQDLVDMYLDGTQSSTTLRRSGRMRRPPGSRDPYDFAPGVSRSHSRTGSVDHTLFTPPPTPRRIESATPSPSVPPTATSTPGRQGTPGAQSGLQSSWSADKSQILGNVLEKGSLDLDTLDKSLNNEKQKSCRRQRRLCTRRGAKKCSPRRSTSQSGASSEDEADDEKEEERDEVKLESEVVIHSTCQVLAEEEEEGDSLSPMSHSLAEKGFQEVGIRVNCKRGQHPSPSPEEQTSFKRQKIGNSRSQRHILTRRERSALKEEEEEEAIVTVKKLPRNVCQRLTNKKLKGETRQEVLERRRREGIPKIVVPEDYGWSPDSDLDPTSSDSGLEEVHPRVLHDKNRSTLSEPTRNIEQVDQGSVDHVDVATLKMNDLSVTFSSTGVDPDGDQYILQPQHHPLLQSVCWPEFSIDGLSSDGVTDSTGVASNSTDSMELGHGLGVLGPGTSNGDHPNNKVYYWSPCMTKTPFPSALVARGEVYLDLFATPDQEQEDQSVNQ